MNEITNTPTVNAVQPMNLDTNNNVQQPQTKDYPPDSFEKTSDIGQQTVGARLPEVKESTVKTFVKWVKRIFSAASAADTAIDLHDKVSPQTNTDSKV